MRRVFLSAIQLEGDSRTDFIRRACGPDAHLRREIESLLAHHDQPVSPIDSPALGHMSEAMTATFPQPTRVGPYRIVRVLGEGAMGVVYLAEQLLPRREVALKVIRPGIVSPSLQRRFEREVEILGRLQHPGIAQIYDAGSATVADGSPVPYFAMELVRGERLVDYANRRSLDRRQRLRLLVRICDAVQHAHLNGIIHRDLKPANILVADDPNDPEAIGQTKILDFGIARCTADDLAATLRTDAGQILGTLAYMAPEQADGTLGGVDARADVHALGVIAFELLTGQLPRTLAGQSIVAAARSIQEQPPRRLAAVDRTLRGDLDTIVARATEPEPPRRYQSPAELAADIERWLAGEPVLARRESIVYLLRRHVRRYRWSLTAALVFIVLAGSFAVYASAQARLQSGLAASEGTARRIATRERNEAMAAREREAEARAAAELAAHRAAAVTSFLTTTLGMADPDVRLSSSASVGDLLRATSETIGGTLADQPDLEADIRAVIGRASFAQGDPASARPQLERAYRLRRADPAATPESVYEVLWPLFQAIEDIGEFSIENLRAEAATVGRAELAQTHAPLAETFAALDRGIGAELTVESANLAWASAQASLASTAGEWTLIGDLYALLADRLERRGRVTEAVRCLEHALDAYALVLPRTNSRAVRATDALTELLLNAGRYAEAARLSEEAIAQASAVLPAEHWYIAAEQAQLGAALAGLGQQDDAARILADSLVAISAQVGPASAYAVRTLRQLVGILESTGDVAAAEARRRELAAALAASMRPVSKVEEIGVAFGPGQGELEGTLRVLQSAVADRSAPLPGPTASVLASTALIAPGEPIAALAADLLSEWAQTVINRSSRDDDAVPMLLEAVRLDGLAPLRHPRKVALPLWFLGQRAEARQESVEGERSARAALDVLQAGPPERFAFTGNAESLLGGCLMDQGRLAEAEPLLRHGYEESFTILGPEDANTRAILLRLVRWLGLVGDLQGATSLLDAELARSMARSDDAWTLAIVREATALPDAPREWMASLENPARAAHERRQGRSRSYESLALLLVRLGRPAEAAALMAAAPEGGSAFVYLAKGIVAHANGDPTATEWLDRAEAQLTRSPTERRQPMTCYLAELRRRLGF